MSTPQPPEQPNDPRQPESLYRGYDEQTADYAARAQPTGNVYPSPDSQATTVVPGAPGASAARRWQIIAGLAIAAAVVVIVGFFALSQQGRPGEAAPVTTTITEVEEIHGEPTTQTATETQTERQTATQTERRTATRTETVTETEVSTRTVTTTVTEAAPPVPSDSSAE